MPSSDYLLESIRLAIQGNIEARIRRFVRNRGTNKWIVAADFVRDEPNTAHDTFVFTIYGFDNDLEKIQEEIKAACPKDIKDTKFVSDETIRILSDGKYFYLCVIADQGRFELASLQEMRESIDQSINIVEGWDLNDRPELLKKFRLLREAAKAKRFNVKLMYDIILMSCIAASVAYFITKHSTPNGILWFIDRDKMMSAHGGIATDLMEIFYSTVCGQRGENISRIKLGAAVEVQATGGQAAWFDELIRLPDYVAGAVARWDYDKVLMTSTQARYEQIITRVVADNDNVAIFKMMFYQQGIICKRVMASKQQLRKGDAAWSASPDLAEYLYSELLRILCQKPRYDLKRDLLCGTGFDSQSYLLSYHLRSVMAVLRIGEEPPAYAGS